MVDDQKGNRCKGNDWVIPKPFIVVFSNGDLPTSPMNLRECIVCGGVFTREESREHSEVRCQPSSGEIFSRGRGWLP
jgi:hypothetical protein